MEEWRKIPGYEDRYEVSNMGRVKSLERTIIDAWGREKHLDEMIFKLKYKKRRTTNKRDARVILSKSNTRKTYLVSRLVAMVWCDGYQDGLTVNHIDGNTENNNATNLEWISNADNIRHGFVTGQYRTQHPCCLVCGNGDIKRFRSISEANRFLGRPDSYIYKCVKRNRPIRSISGDVYGLV